MHLIVFEAKIMSRMGRVEEVSPLVAEILGLYDKKLSLMESMITHNDDRDNSITETQQVNLSASGMSFESNTPINEGVNLKMELVLFPEYQFHTCLCTCCRLQKKDGR